MRDHSNVIRYTLTACFLHVRAMEVTDSITRMAIRSHPSQNCLMLINTLLVERTVEREGLWERLTAEDLRALTPLFHGHINPYGQFALDLARPSFLEVA
jgi:hypothetical protein